MKKMFKQNAPQSGFLQEMVRVKKIRFKDIEDLKSVTKPYKGNLQRSANFREFQQVYESSGQRRNVNIQEKESGQLHKTKSGSFYKLPTFTKSPQYVETISIELPANYGTDRAVRMVENKIKPKRANPKVHREVTTERIVARLKKIDEVPEQIECAAQIPKKQLEEIHKDIKQRKETILKNLPKPLVIKPKKKHQKIYDTLSDINKKLFKMQEKYYSQPKIHYRSVNDCFTQSGNVEVIYENVKYPEDVKLSCNAVASNVANVSGDTTIDDLKTQENLKGENRLFPEFPMIEDTLKDIETHLDNIVNLNNVSRTFGEARSTSTSEQIEKEFGNYYGAGSLGEILGNLNLNKKSSSKQTARILQSVNHAKGEKLKTIRKQIATVEEFCDRMSEIANEESEDSADVGMESEEEEEWKNDGKESGNIITSKGQKAFNLGVKEIPDFIEGPELQATINKSNFLSKEFNKGGSGNSMIKIFSDNERKILWKKKLRLLHQKEEPNIRSVESITKMIDNLKFTLENSIYEPVA